MLMMQMKQILMGSIYYRESGVSADIVRSKLKKRDTTEKLVSNKSAAPIDSDDEGEYYLGKDQDIEKRRS